MQRELQVTFGDGVRCQLSLMYGLETMLQRVIALCVRMLYVTKSVINV
jgi:hypothetical protein